MRYQERIYIQNDNRGVRNKDILNVNMSSDICVFKSPTFNVSGATKIQCDSINCNLSGVSLNNIFSASTGNCATTAITLCHSATTWSTNIYEDSELVSSYNFYTTEIFGDIPTNTQFLNSITLSFRNLGYSFSKNGSNFSIDKPYGVKNLEIDVCVSFYSYSEQFHCPATYDLTPNNESCQNITTINATYNGSTGTTIVSGDKNGPNYSVFGAYFYPELNTNLLPVYRHATGQLRDSTGGTINPLVINNTSSYWASLSLSGNGRLNNVGISGTNMNFEYVGLSKCININSGGTYYVGIAGDNYARLYIDGVNYVNLTGFGVTENFRIWSVFPINLTSGEHIIEVYGRNINNTIGAFGAEIYYPTGTTPFNTLTGATSSGDTNPIFSTSDYIGQPWELGSTIGYSCPIGYSLKTCEIPYKCVKILTSNVITGCTGTTCLDNCVVVCNDTFPYINNTSQGVYILSGTQSSIPFTFNFTGNTGTFLDTNAAFKYEIYRYLSNSNVFKLPAVYKSELFPYSSFSATSAITVSIPTSNLNFDGEYIIKGYFETEACTDFLRRLGKKIDTSIYKTGSAYSLYVPETDAYFLSIRAAETPVFNGSGSDEPTYSPVNLYQQVIKVDFANEGNIPAELDEPELYERTGSTFVLTGEYTGDVLLTLNGLTLAKDVDYTLSGQVLTFLGPISNGDIITIFYTRTSTTTLISNTILINSIIPSGATDTQGSSKYFYNTTSGKYEVYTNNQPLGGTKIIVMLNGVTLADNIDYYQSTSNPNRIILNGGLIVGDIINLIYYPAAIIIDGITQKNTLVGWNIFDGPTLQNGEFSLEYSQSSNFSSYTISDVVPYQINVTEYSGLLTLTGDVGTKLYYRVKNTKTYRSICGDPIESIAYSETVPVVIQSNAINSY